MDGCTYCGKDDDQLVYSEETDAYLHVGCLQAEIEKRPRDPEMRALAQEFARLLSSLSEVEKGAAQRKLVGTG